MQSASRRHHSLRTMGLWALGGAAVYLIARELTTAGRGHRAGPTTPSTMPERGVSSQDGVSSAEAQLDAAVDATFPASDAISMRFE